MFIRMSEGTFPRVVKKAASATMSTSTGAGTMPTRRSTILCDKVLAGPVGLSCSLPASAIPPPRSQPAGP